PVGAGPMHRQLAGDVDVVLQRDRDAEQRTITVASAAGVGLIRLGKRTLRHHDAIGVQLRVQALDALQVELDELARAHLTLANELGLACEAGESQIDLVHEAAPYPHPATIRGVDRLPDGVLRVRASNPSPMTLDGTNTY